MTAREEIAHALNEWADLGSNALQWLRNVKDGISTPDDALAEMKSNYDRVLGLSRAALRSAAAPAKSLDDMDIADMLCQRDCLRPDICDGTETTWCGQKGREITAALLKAAAPAVGAEPVGSRILGEDKPEFALLLYLTSKLGGLNEGPFKDGFQTAIEEGGAYLDDAAGDGGDQAQTLMEQMCGLINGVYALTEIKGPMGAVATPPDHGGREAMAAKPGACPKCGCDDGVAGEPYWRHDNNAPWTAAASFTCDRCDHVWDLDLRLVGDCPAALSSPQSAKG